MKYHSLSPPSTFKKDSSTASKQKVNDNKKATKKKATKKIT